MQIEIPQQDIEYFKKKSAEKIQAENWEGRNKEVKINNFVNCWVTEEAFKKILINKKVFFRNRGLYIGDSQGAGNDFILKKDNQEVSIGIRSTTERALERFREIAYPDDRFRKEHEHIADHIVACTHENGVVKFYGVISKQILMESLEKSRRIYSKQNQEYFRVVSIEKFSLEGMDELLENCDKV